jgi:hypothetical protein
MDISWNHHHCCRSAAPQIRNSERAVVEAGAASPRARALIEDGAARGAASQQQEPLGGRYRSRASLRREELSLWPPADARQKLHNCQSCSPYAGTKGLEQSER